MSYELVSKEEDDEMSLPLHSGPSRPATTSWRPPKRPTIFIFVSIALLLLLYRVVPVDEWEEIRETVRKAPSYLPSYHPTSLPDSLNVVDRPAFDDKPSTNTSSPARRLSTYNGLRGEELKDILKPTIIPDHATTTCSLDSSSLARFAPLSRGQGPILLAMNLYENEKVLPTFLRELPMLISFLGPSRLHLSLYENGSKDKTVDLIRHLCWQLDQLGASFTVHSKGAEEESHKGAGHRIHVLAALRNKLLLPLSDPAVAEPGGHFETVLFMNDIHFCASDVLEVLLQRRMQGASLSCSTDWNFNPPRFYDQWVTRDTKGATFYHKKDWETRVDPLVFPDNAADRKRWEHQLPVQMSSCWNGIAVFSAEAFLPPHSLSFRTSHDTSAHSECLLISVDLWKAGLGRIVMTPRARVAYSVEDYEAAQAMFPKPALDRSTFGAWSEEERVDFVEEMPERMLLFRDGWWGDGEWTDPRTI